jgi:hypothetical protein
MLSTRDGKLFAGDKEVIKGYESFSGWYWFATELTDDDYMGHPLYFGYVQGFENEWGSFWMGELQPLIDSMKVWEIKPQDLPHAGRR